MDNYTAHLMNLIDAAHKFAASNKRQQNMMLDLLHRTAIQYAKAHQHLKTNVVPPC